jgi:hypothetical protein
VIGGCQILLDAVKLKDSATISHFRGPKRDCPQLEHELFRALLDDRMEQFALLLQAGADPNGSYGDYCSPPLGLAYELRGFAYANGIASAGRDTTALELLFKAGADPNRPWTPETGPTRPGIDSGDSFEHAGTP